MSAPTIICQKCGKHLGATIRFCGMCGTPVPVQDSEDRTPTDVKIAPNASTQPHAGAAPPRNASAKTTKPGQPGPRTQAKTAPMPSGQAAATPSPPVAPQVPAPPVAPSPPVAPTRTQASSPPGGPSAASGAPPRVVALVQTPPKTDAPKPPSSRSEFQRLLEEVESGFESIVKPKGAAPSVPPEPRGEGPKPSEPTGEIPHDLTEARNLFDAIVVQHARPIRDFMIEVRLGEPLRAWVDFCLPALRAILRSAQGMGITELVAKIQSFAQAVEFAQTGSDRLVRGQIRQAIIDTYSELIAYMPQAFALEQEANRRESVIVHSLLQQVPGLHKVSTDRIYGAGLTSLALFYVARPNDIAELTGISAELAQAVVDRFRDYRKKTESLSPEHNRSAELKVLLELASTLERVVGEYDALSPGGASDVKRRELRRIRSDAMIEVGLLLARLGEVDRLREIEKLPFAARAASVRVYVIEAQKRERGSRP